MIVATRIPSFTGHRSRLMHSTPKASRTPFSPAGLGLPAGTPPQVAQLPIAIVSFAAG